jgi:putative transposase
MAPWLTYQMFFKLLSWIVLRARSDTTKEIEILVLRHQLAVLQRRTPRPRMSWADRALIAALARHWTTQPARPGRPAIPAGVRALVLRLATASAPSAANSSTAS